jgi:hypothetical protein
MRFAPGNLVTCPIRSIPMGDRAAWIRTYGSGPWEVFQGDEQAVRLVRPNGVSTFADM